VSPPLAFEVLASDPSGARRGRVTTRHGSFETPAFMPVGTQATVKAVTSGELVQLGAEVILGNAYHLWVRPGADRIARLGGLHRFMGWTRPILTDSGGFQVMSLAELRHVSDDGVRFRCHLDGRPLFLSPEESVRIQRALGSDIMMALDECPALPADRATLESAVDRTTRWAARCLEEWREGDGALFGIVQGGTDAELRERSAAALTGWPFHGFALGGLSVGESPDVTRRVVRLTAALLPADRPRYLMGVGRPEDLVEAVWRGVDMFDCVLPTRNARNGSLFTASGSLNIKRAEHAEAAGPVDEACACEVCRTHSRAYLRHLFVANEILGSRLNTVHNLHHVLQLMRDLRAAIDSGSLAELRRRFWAARGQEPPDDGSAGRTTAR
jgi:queuine tRNA-ribosyltransferase